MKQFNELEIGQWYAPMFMVTDSNGETREDIGDFYKYLGGKEFLDESGEVVTGGLYDPDLGCQVAVDAADGYAQ